MKKAQEKVILKTVEKKATKALDSIQAAIKEAKEAVEVTKPVQPGTCFYIQSLGEDGKTETGLVLEANTVDKYAPRKTGVYNVALRKWNKGNKAQMWTWEDNERLTPMLYKGKALLEGSNKNLIIYKFRKMKQQRFAYDEVNHVFAETFTKNVLNVKGNIADRANVVTAPYNKKPSEKWKISYCDE